MKIEVKGIKELLKAFSKNPEVVRRESGKLMVRVKAEYLKIIMRSPWQLGGHGGGAPVKTGNLRDTHVQKITDFSMTITPEPSRRFPNYSNYVHEGTSRLRARPWLDYAIQQAEEKVNQLMDDMTNNIIKNLES